MERNPDAVLDEYLVVLAQGGSRAAFARLAGRWMPRLRRHAQRLLFSPERAGDAVQEAWLNIASGLRRLDDPARFPAWAFAITSRKCIDAIRRRSRDHRLAAEATAVTAVAGAFDPVAGADTRLDLSAAIGRLPVDQRLLVSLFYGEDLSVHDIAAALSLPPGTVKSRLHAARRALKIHLEGGHHDPCR